jgi:hypothetical protein
MIQFEVKPEEILEVLQAEFPKEFTIAVQRVHIRKLEERLNSLAPDPSLNGSPKEAING